VNRYVAVLLLLSSVVAFAERPRLGVVIIVDQLSSDAFQSRLPGLTGGIKRMASEGYVFVDGRYEAAPTITSVGHATIATGAYGEVHGIVANDWIDAETGKPRLSIEDPSFAVLGRPAKGREGTAPTWLLAPTLADTVHLASAKALTLTVSGKDRSSILSAGRNGISIWFDAESPIFTTSTFYAKEIPPFVLPINQRIQDMIVKGAFQWGLPGGGITGQSPVLPAQSGRTDDNEPFAERIDIQAMLDTAQVDVALEGIKAMGLGQDDVPDLLTLSFSGHDRVGHQLGPEAPQSLAEYVQVDKEIGRLLSQLDVLVGRGKYVVAFTSDHGVAPMPEVAQARGLDAGRIHLGKLKEVLDAELDQQLGRQDWFAPAKTPGLTFAPGLRARAMPMLSRLQKLAKQQPGVLDLLSGQDLRGPWGRLFSKGAYEGRSPDLFVINRPFWTYGVSDQTGHASGYLYDRSVPVMFFGANIKKGQGGTTEVIHLAPTMAQVLGIPIPAAAQGHALREVLR
jgi:predicted AlkP superfamily pyrophosphatase or phosphodiesterase